MRTSIEESLGRWEREERHREDSMQNNDDAERAREERRARRRAFNHYVSELEDYVKDVDTPLALVGDQTFEEMRQRVMHMLTASRAIMAHRNMPAFVIQYPNSQQPNPAPQNNAQAQNQNAQNQEEPEAAQQPQE